MEFCQRIAEKCKLLPEDCGKKNSDFVKRSFGKNVNFLPRSQKKKYISMIELPKKCEFCIKGSPKKCEFCQDSEKSMIFLSSLQKKNCQRAMEKL